MTRHRPKKLHVDLTDKLDAELRSLLKEHGHEDGGVYLYVSHVNGRKSPTPPLTDADKRSICSLYNSNKATVAEIAQLFGKSRQAIYYVLRDEE